MASLGISDFRKTFFCGAINRNDLESWNTYNEEYFPTFAIAEQYYYELVKDKTKYIFLGELGGFKNDNDSIEIDWIICRSNCDKWWRDNYVDDGDPHKNDRGFGVPWNKDGKYSIKYQIVEFHEVAK